MGTVTGDGSSLPRHRGGSPSTTRGPPEEVPEENGGGIVITADLPGHSPEPEENHPHPHNNV